MKQRVSVRLEADIVDAIERWRKHHEATTGARVTFTVALEALIRRAIGATKEDEHEDA